jgi:hypothetical protein
MKISKEIMNDLKSMINDFEIKTDTITELRENKKNKFFDFFLPCSCCDKLTKLLSIHYDALTNEKDWNSIKPLLQTIFDVYSQNNSDDNNKEKNTFH